MTTAQPGSRSYHETRLEQPWTNNDGMVKFIEFPVRIEGMSHRAFHLYWTRHHSPHVMNATPFSQYIRKYSTSHVYPDPVEGLPDHYRHDAPFEGAAEIWINSLGEVSDWMAHPIYAELIQPDELRFIRQDGSVEVIIAKEEKLYEPRRDLTETGMTKVHLLVSKRPGMDHDAFHEAASAYGRLILERPALRSTLRALTVSHRLREPALEGFIPADIDAVFELWFNGREDIAAFFADVSVDESLRRQERQYFDAARIRAVVGRMLVVHDELSFQPSTMQPLSLMWNNEPVLGD